MPGPAPVTFPVSPEDGGVLAHVTNRVDLVVLPWRSEEVKATYTSSASLAYVGVPPEGVTSSPYDTDIWAGGYDEPLRVVVGNGAVGAGTLQGCEVQFDFMGSLFGVVQTWSGNANSDAFSFPFTAVIDGTAYPVDPRQPWLDFPATASTSGTWTQRATIIARGLHPGRHHCVLEFSQDPLGTSGGVSRDWLLNAQILERNDFNRPPPPVEIVQNADAIAVGTDGTASPPQIAIRGLSAPPVLGITRILVTNTTGSPVTFYYRPYMKYGTGASSTKYIARQVPAYDSIEIAPTGGRFWPQEVQCYASATGLTARAYYQR